MNDMGHNENAVRLAALAGDAKAALDSVSRGEADAFDGWLAYGAALNAGRALFAGDREFGQWVHENVLWQLASAHLSSGAVENHERLAAMWAAGNADQLAEARATCNARTPRGLHKQWKKLEAEREEDRLREDRRTRDEAERAERETRAAQARLDRQKAEADERAARKAAAAARNDDERKVAQARVDDAARAKADADAAAQHAIAPDPVLEMPDPYAAERKELARYTHEGLEDALIEVRIALADEKAKRKVAEAERNDFKAKWQEVTGESDMGRALGNAQRQRDTAKGRLAEEQAKNARQQRRINILDAEIKKLRVMLENQVIPL